MHKRMTNILVSTHILVLPITHFGSCYAHFGQYI